jgi:site-specific DNA-methyltransferase (adenine-specific)
VFPYISDKSVNLILCDLPYGTTACKWDSVLPFDKLWNEYERIITDNGAIVLTASQPFTSALVMSNPKMFKYEWVWDKVSHTNPFIAKYRCLSVHENILVFAKGKTIYNPQKYFNGVIRNDKGKNGKRLGELFINNDVGYTRNMDGFANPKSIITIQRESISGSNEERTKNSLHPTQKPLELMKYLIKTYSNEDDVVMDNCMGSNTTGLACKELNRQYIGIEKDKNYYDVSVRRVLS